MADDEKNYRMFLEGDNQGFEELVITYKDNLIYFINRYVKDLNQAEDLAQDAFVEILIHKERYHFKTSFKTYLFTIGRNKAIDYIRKNSRHILMEEMEERVDEQQKIEEHIIREEEKRTILSSLKKLKPDYQAAIMLIDIEELSYYETGQILHKNLPQVKVLIHRARKALKKVLEGEGFGHENR